MGRAKNTIKRVPFSTSIDEQLIIQLRLVAEETGIAQNRLVEKAINDFIKHKRKEKNSYE